MQEGRGPLSPSPQQCPPCGRQGILGSASVPRARLRLTVWPHSPGACGSGSSFPEALSCLPFPSLAAVPRAADFQTFSGGGRQRWGLPKGFFTVPIWGSKEQSI